MRRLGLVIISAVFSVAILPPSALAQRGGGAGSGSGPVPTIEDHTDDMQKLDGFYPLYWDDDAGTLFLEIPSLGEEVLYQTGLAAGLGSNDIGLDRAQLGSTAIVAFERVGRQILMVQPNYDYRATTDNPAERRAVDDAFAKSVLWGFTVEAATDGRHLVDLTGLVVRDAHGVGNRLGGYSLDRSRSAIYMPNTNVFPANTEIEVTTTFTSGGGGGRGGRGGGPGQAGGRIGDVTPTTSAATVRQHHSFIQLPDDNYQPRAYDPRSGFGSSGYVDYAVPLGENMRKRFIRRHRLEKRDPTAAVSEAVEPIVYYVDRGTPEPILSALVEGASWWSEAFEAAGFSDGFRVEVMPEGADPMDVRYNTITWVHRSTRGWSYGSSITDPRTGEIIKGHVTLGSLRVRQDYLIFEGLLSPYTTGTETPPELAATALARLRQLSAHEVGHTIGLGHNYYNSTQGRISVLDYPHPLITLRSDGTMDLSAAYDVGIGEWDKVTVRYGYTHFAPGTDAPAELQRILDDAWAADLRYMTNQDLSLSPGVDQWNNGVNNAEELNRLMTLRRTALARIGENAIKQGAPLATIEEALVPVYLHHRYAAESAATTLGGQDYIYALRGDGREPVSWVPAARQQAALDSLLLTLRPGELALPADLLAKIPPRPAGFGRSRETFPRLTGGAFDPIAPAIVAADMTMGFMLQSDRAARLVTQQALDPSLPGLDDVLERLTMTVFAAETSDGYEAEIKRAMERVLINHLMRLANSAPMAQVRALADQRLRRIVNGGPTWPAADQSDLPMVAHRNLLRTDVQRFLDRPYVDAPPVQAPNAPPGAPIGDYGLDYLLGIDFCAWRWDGGR